MHIDSDKHKPIYITNFQEEYLKSRKKIITFYKGLWKSLRFINGTEKTGNHFGWRSNVLVADWIQSSFFTVLHSLQFFKQQRYSNYCVSLESSIRKSGYESA